MSEERQTGRTTKQMLEADQGAIYVWPYAISIKSYARPLAHHLGRQDLKIIPASEFTPERCRGTSNIVIDHATHLTEEQKHLLKINTKQRTSMNDIAAGSVASNAVLATLHERQGEHYLRFQPHGYEFPIALPVITHGSREAANAWTWNGSLENPTLKPSIKTTHADGKVSHIWLTDGMCRHLDDSTDGLAGQTLPLMSLANTQAMASEGLPSAIGSLPIDPITSDTEPS